MLNQRDFVSFIRAIKKEDKRLEKLGKNLGTLGDGWIVVDNPLTYSIVSFLERAMGDKFDIISWWLWEDVEKIIYDNNKKIDVSTPQKLYKYLVKEIKENEYKIKN